MIMLYKRLLFYYLLCIPLNIIFNWLFLLTICSMINGPIKSYKTFWFITSDIDAHIGMHSRKPRFRNSARFSTFILIPPITVQMCEVLRDLRDYLHCDEKQNNASSHLMAARRAMARCDQNVCLSCIACFTITSSPASPIVN